MSVDYSPATQVQGIARKVIHAHHEHLIDIDVSFVFRSEHAERHGHVVLGKARKVSGLNAFLVHQAELSGVSAEVNGTPLDLTVSDAPFFVIEIARDFWNVLDPAEREALVDHELSHCRVKVNKEGETQLYIAPHDVEEFSSVLQRRGLWQPNLKEFLRAAKAHQPNLWSEIDEGEDGEATVTNLMAARG